MVLQRGRLSVKTSIDFYFLKLIRLQGLFAHARRCDIKMISVVVSYADITVSAGDPVSAISFDQGITYGF
jgi:hypothetical protein